MREKPKNGEPGGSRDVVNVDFVKRKKVERPEDVTDPKKPGVAQRLRSSPRTLVLPPDVRALEEAAGITMQPPESESLTGAIGIEQAEEELETMEDAEYTMAAAEKLVDTLAQSPAANLETLLKNPGKLNNAYDVFEHFFRGALHNRLFIVRNEARVRNLSEKLAVLIAGLESIETKTYLSDIPDATEVWFKLHQSLTTLRKILLEKLAWLPRVTS